MIEWNRGEAIAREFAGAALPDSRLEPRLVKLASAMANRPSVGLPRAVGGLAELEGAYRFLNNGRVTPQEILAPHVARSVERARERDECLVIHDTTEFRFNGESERVGLGPLKGGSARGFFAHVSLVLRDAESRMPLGVLALDPWVRSDTPKRSNKKSPKKRVLDSDRESLRWAKGVDAAENVLGDSTRALHVMDREGDAYDLFARLIDEGRHFVIRAAHDRLLMDESSKKLFEKLESLSLHVTREVPLVRRGRRPLPTARRIFPARKARTATLGIGSCRVRIRRPKDLPASSPASLDVNIVIVRELDVPNGEPAVSWTLITSEPIASNEAIAHVVDVYRARWVIEELFKALKTGCAFEKRQLTSYDALLRALSISLPIAWQLLRIRHGAQIDPDAPATSVLSSTQIRLLGALLKSEKNEKIPSQPTVKDALLGIACLGGHLARNGPPGWLTLGQGYEELLAAERGWLAMTAEM